MKYLGMDPFLAIADPTRRHIVEMLGEGALSAGEIGGRFRLSPPAISQHLKVLREAGLVQVRVSGQRRIYSLHPEGLEAFEAWVSKVRGEWSGRLGALERELSKSQGDER